MMVVKTIQHHIEKKPDIKDFIYPINLFEYWKTIPINEKRTSEMDFPDGRARDTFNGFINFRIDLIN